MKHAVNQPCIVCGSDASRLLHSVTYAEAGYPGTFEMRECTQCGLLFHSPRLSDGEIQALYDGGYYVFQEPERDALQRVALLASRTVGVAQTYTDARQVLEIGCAKGYLLALLAARGWQVRGVEISPEAGDFARRRFSLDVFIGSVESWVESLGFVPTPLLLSTDVVEHVTDPLAFLRAAHQAITPGGWLVLATPNAESDHRQALGAQWLGFNPFHIYIYSRRTLGALLARAGFEVVHSYTYTNSEVPVAYAGAGLRDAVRGALAASGLLAAARRARSAVSAIFDWPVTARELAAACADGGPAGLGSYLASADGRSLRRATCRGDNLVLLAQRRL